MVYTNCWECGKLLNNDLRELGGIKYDKIFCKKCRKNYQKNQASKSKEEQERLLLTHGKLCPHCQKETISGLEAMCRNCFKATIHELGKEYRRQGKRLRYLLERHGK